jgi:hypothetical protein
MASCRESRVKRIGGRPSAVSSVHNAWNIGHAMSGSRAPSSQRRKRVIFDCIGIGRWCSLLNSKELRMAELDFDIRVNHAAV